MSERGVPSERTPRRPRFAPRWPRRWQVVTVVLLVGALGSIVRLHMLFDPDPLFYGVYDDGVHFSAAVNLVHGNLPYREVLFLQPPGLLLAVAPFALLANWIGDANAFIDARVVFALIGGLNGALIALVLRRFGLAAMVVGGVLYAVSFAASYDERTVTLEVIGATGVLTALVLLDVADRRPARRWIVLAGVAAGVSIDFKIWYLVPAVVLAVVAWRRIGWFVLGAAAAVIAVYLPFFAAAPAKMWRDVVRAQLGRPLSTGNPPDIRLSSMLGIAPDDSVGSLFALLGPTVLTVLLVLVGVLALGALTVRGGRRHVALMLACGLLLVYSPSYFQHYAQYAAGPLALVGGVGAVQLGERVGRYRRPILVLSVVAAVLLQLSVSLREVVDVANQKVVPVAELRAASARIPGCIVTDDPTFLILMDRLTPEIRNGCTVRSDPSGYGYVLTPTGGKQVFRPDNPVWQRSAMAYLHRADAYVLTRGKVFGLTPANEARVRRDRVLDVVGPFSIRTGR
jgi:hypothetical protein